MADTRQVVGLGYVDESRWNKKGKVNLVFELNFPICVLII